MNSLTSLLNFESKNMMRRGRLDSDSTHLSQSRVKFDSRLMSRAQSWFRQLQSHTIIHECLLLPFEKNMKHVLPGLLTTFDSMMPFSGLFHSYKSNFNDFRITGMILLTTFFRRALWCNLAGAKKQRPLTLKHALYPHKILKRRLK